MPSTVVAADVKAEPARADSDRKGVAGVTDAGAQDQYHRNAEHFFHFQLLSVGCLSVRHRVGEETQHACKKNDV
jgi:hypothetical protein